MILYLDASALVKRYIAEIGAPEVAELLAHARFVGTGLISRAEVAAALAKAVRVGILDQTGGLMALNAFRAEWPQLLRVQITEEVISRADTLAWEYGLRGYDAVHLASALLWQTTLHEAVTLATFDRQLWHATRQVGLVAWPEDLSAFRQSR